MAGARLFRIAGLFALALAALTATGQQASAQLTGISPTSGPIAGGTSVQIFADFPVGTTSATVNSVTIGGAAVNVTNVSSSGGILTDFLLTISGTTGSDGTLPAP